jgi:hypothetical protein
MSADASSCASQSCVSVALSLWAGTKPEDLAVGKLGRTMDMNTSANKLSRHYVTLYLIYITNFI